MSRKWPLRGNCRPAEKTTPQESIGPAVTCPSFDLDNLLHASAEVLGEGRVGTSYKTTLESGDELVVKRLRGVGLSKKKFELRAMVIVAIRNKHIAPLQWYYYSKNEKMLVYNIFPMGSLAHALHGEGISGLNWEQRAAIGLATARGVEYIHSAGPSSFHGNIKSSNVMLTGTHGLTTLGLFPGASVYSAPEITDDARRVSQKAGVYSFGVLLLTGEDPMKNTHLKEQWVDEKEKWVLDVELPEMMMRLLQVVIICCSSHAVLRPTMSYVVERMEEIIGNIHCA